MATFGNWVSKTANLLQDDLGAQPGDRLALLLPAHWQTAVWLLAAFSTGVVVAPGGDPAGADLVVSGPDTLEAARACGGERIALALRPLGGRFPQPPPGFADYAVEVPGQGDRFAPYVPIGPEAPALELPGGEVLTAGDVVSRARDEAVEARPGERLTAAVRAAVRRVGGAGRGSARAARRRRLRRAVPSPRPTPGRSPGPAQGRRARHPHRPLVTGVARRPARRGTPRQNRFLGQPRSPFDCLNECRSGIRVPSPAPTGIR